MSEPVEIRPWPEFEDDEIEAAAAVLRSGRVNYWTGTECRQFESEFADLCGRRYAVALANGTVALELALEAGGIGPGDEVIVTPRSFLASASCAVMRGARPIFADVDRDSQNITPETIEAVLTPRTRAIVAVHHAGWPCDMDGLMDIAKANSLLVVEDCAQAHGATYEGRPVGGLGHVGAFSFCQDKIMTTGGEGGMLVTNDPAIWDRAWSFKDHGKSYAAVHTKAEPPGFRWLHESFGTNWRMTEVQAAIGRIQLRKLDSWVARRRRNAAVLADCFNTIPALRVTTPADHIGHAYYKYYAFVRPEELKSSWDRDRIMRELNAAGVPCFSGSCPEIYLEKAFEDTGWRPRKRLPAAQELGMTSLMFLVHPTLDEADIRANCATVREVFGRASLGSAP